MDQKIIEINGIKMSVDERTATVKKIETFSVGMPVKLLLKEYSGYEVKFGVIVGFDAFEKQPTITVAYLNYSEIKYCYIRQGSEHEILPVEAHDMAMEKTWILDRMDDRIRTKERELSEERSKRDHFVAHFGKYFEQGLPNAEAVK